MWYQIYAFILITIFFFIAVYRKSSLFSPVSVNCMSWYLTFIPGMIFSGYYYPIKENVFIAWVVWFCTLNFIFFILEPKSIKQLNIDSNSRREIKFNYQYVVYFLSLFLLYRIWVVGSSGPEQFFLNLRLGANGIEGFEGIGYIGLFYPLILSLFIFENVFSLKKRDKIQKIISLSIWLILFAVATMGKFAVIIPILTWVVINVLKRQMGLFKIMIVAFISIFLMLSIHIVRASENSTFDLFKSISVYTYSPFVALGYIDFSLPHDFGVVSLRFFHAVIYSLGYGNPPINLIFPYVSVPIVTNVYTVLFPFFYDFNLFGVFVFAVIYGLLFGFLYLGALCKNKYFISLYVMFVPYLFTQFFAEGVFSVLSSNIQMAICLLFLFLISRRVNHG